MSKFTVEEIRELAEILSRNNLESIRVEDGDYSLEITAAERREAAAGYHHRPEEAAPDAPERQSPPGQLVTSPIVGVFYSAPSPGAEPFVKVGTRVSTGDVLCIIEAMKLMNEITAEFDGEVVEVFAENGEIVDFGRPLFRIN